MNKKARYIVLLIIILLYFIVLFLIFGKDNLKREKEETIIIIGNNTVWKKEKQKWSSIDSQSDKKKLEWQLYDTYINNEKIGKYYLWSDNNEWFLFDKQKNAYNYQGNLLAYKSNYKIPVKSFTTEDTTDQTYLQKLLSDNNLSETGTPTISSISKIDIDNDGVDEKFYVFSNIFSYDEVLPKNSYSFVFMEKENKLYMMYSFTDKFVGLSGCQPFISHVMDIDEDNNYEIVLTCSQYDELPPINTLYKFEKNKFIKITSDDKQK